MSKTSNKINFFVPLEFEKGMVGSNQEMKVKGVCSTIAEDTDGETLLPTGFDFAPLLQKGFLNWNHQGNKTASAIIGRPTKAEVINDGRDFYIEGYLYKGSAEAKSVYELAEILENEDPDRRLGFSIEGQAIEKDPINPKIIRRARITGVAITACPKNPNTLLSLMKGEYSDSFVTDGPSMIQLIQEYKDWAGNDTHFGDIGSVQEFLENYHEDHLALKDELCQEVNKSMTAAGAEGVTQKESVEGGQKILESLHKIEKSEVFSQIIDKYNTYDEEIIKSIYSLIEKVNIQNNMGEVINQEIINKSFEILEQANALVKSEDTSIEGTVEEVETGEEIEKSSSIGEEVKVSPEVEKAIAMARENFSNGMDENTCTEDMIRKGCSLVETQSAIATVVSEMNAVAEGGTVQVLTDTPVSKSEDNEFGVVENIGDLVKGVVSEELSKLQFPTLDLSSIGDLVKSEISNISTSLGTQFVALSTILKSQSEQNSALAKEITELKKSNEDITTEFNKIKEAPVQARSITKVSQVERFQKSQDTDINAGNTFNLNIKEDREQLTDKLFNEYSLIKSQGRDDYSIAKAIQDIEGSQTVLPEQQARLKQLGINLIKQ